MQNRHLIKMLLVLLSLTFILGACGGDEEEPVVEETAVSPPTNTNTNTPDPTPVPEVVEEPASGAATSYQDVQSAVIQIEAQGSFVDPQEGLQLNAAGRGSGFIIDESGIAVTNNHVVTGAAFLKVWVGGEDEPRNAKILGVSECSDLAVIDIDGDGFPYLDWYSGDAKVGLDIYVAGFPLGDPEYTLTRGIISKLEAGGRTPWSSVEHVVEYDANTNPGTSGGPVVAENGQVVAVNYAGRADTRQAFGISYDVAQDVVAQLRQKQDLHSIGVNGSAINDGEGLSGIWVSSVKSGSPADQAGVEAGDIITKIEGLVMSEDGSMGDYCDILRGHDADDTLSIEVLRYATQEIMEGQLNGDPLEQSFSFAQAVDQPTSSGGGGETYSEYVGVYDNANAIYVEVPKEWADVDGSFWDVDGDVIGSSLTAAPSVDGFNGNFETPGVLLLASNGLAESDMGELIDNFNFRENCTYDGRSDYEDPVYTGVYDFYSNCGGVGSVLIVLGAEPADSSYSIVLVGQAVTPADLDAMDHVLDTFNVVDTLPGS